MYTDHPGLSPEMNAAIRSSEENASIDIKAQKKGTMLEVVSEHTRYTMVIVDHGKSEVAMRTDNPNIEGTDIWILLGAGWGGSMMKIGWICVGAQMRMRRLRDDGLIETSAVKGFAVCNNPEEAKRIVEGAEINRPVPMTEEEAKKSKAEFAVVVEKIITNEFPADKQDSIREMTGRFGNMPAKATVLGILSQAHKHGKLSKCMELMERYWGRYWVYQPPPVAGDPGFMPLNARRWDALYHELDIPLPG